MAVLDAGPMCDGARSHARLNRTQRTAMSQLERSPQVHRHSKMVAQLARRVGLHMRLAVRELSDLVRTAEFHDIGKLGISAAILDKPGPLDDFEQQIMRGHTISGERMLQGIPGLAQVAKAVRSCHERFDGNGYPDGLSGDTIPLTSRIVFVCDAFAAMTADRPYRAAKNTREALDEIKRCAGTQFDPPVVEAFLAVLSDRATDASIPVPGLSVRAR